MDGISQDNIVEGKRSNRGEDPMAAERELDGAIDSAVQDDERTSFLLSTSKWTNVDGKHRALIERKDWPKDK